MERYFRPFETVIALYGHYLVSVFFRHGCLCDFLFNLLRHLPLYLFIIYWLLAKRANVICFSIVNETIQMHWMATLKEMYFWSSCVEICQTNRTILLQARGHTFMTPFHLDRKTASTCVTMEKIFSTPESADTALVTMKYSFLFKFIIVKRANWTVI